jgi:hypothetical protein
VTDGLLIFESQVNKGIQAGENAKFSATKTAFKNADAWLQPYR